VLVAALALVAAPSRNFVPKLYEVLASRLRLPGCADSYGWPVPKQQHRPATSMPGDNILVSFPAAAVRGVQRYLPITGLPRRMCLSVPALGWSVEPPRVSL